MNTHTHMIVIRHKYYNLKILKSTFCKVGAGYIGDVIILLMCLFYTTFLIRG